ncbi:hypothetical protein [Streptomyces sp. NPDC058086]|uniref:hypothetical protein n=1 Tax=Streptomyces sp. NPDC058086 TaxID=3346334 RepID=UPI0036EC4541
MEWDAPDTPANAAAFGSSGGSAVPAAFPKVRVLTLAECGWHASLAAAIGPSTGKHSGAQTLAMELFPRLEPGMLLLADRGFYGFDQSCTVAESGADVLWRMSDGPTLSKVADPARRFLPVAGLRPEAESRSARAAASSRLD